MEPTFPCKPHPVYMYGAAHREVSVRTVAALGRAATLSLPSTRYRRQGGTARCVGRGEWALVDNPAHIYGGTPPCTIRVPVFPGTIRRIHTVRNPAGLGVCACQMYWPFVCYLCVSLDQF